MADDERQAMIRGVAHLIGRMLIAALIITGPGLAAGPSGAGAVMNLLKSGKVPPERLGPVLEIVCTRGNAQELAFVYERVLQPDAFPATCGSTCSASWPMRRRPAR